MSKNVSIMEGGKPYNFTVDKIKTGLSSAGEATWIPEDSYKTGVLACNKKWATYKASGVVGWHRVYINDTGSGSGPDEYPSLGEHDVSIQESGIQEDYSGVDRVDLAGVSGRERFVYDGDITTGTLTKTVDGDTAAAVYDASSDGVQAYTEVTVRGLADGLQASWSGNQEFQPGGSIFVNSWNVRPVYKDGTLWVCDEHPQGIISECIFSPETIPENIGDSCDVTISWPRYDDEKVLSSVVRIPVGFIMPHHIVVTTLPNVTSYNEGQAISYTGIVVTAYNSNGTPWNQTGYPNGVIPFNELTFPETVADFNMVLTGRNDALITTSGVVLTATKNSVDYEFYKDNDLPCYGAYSFNQISASGRYNRTVPVLVSANRDAILHHDWVYGSGYGIFPTTIKGLTVYMGGTYIDDAVSASSLLLSAGGTLFDVPGQGVNVEPGRSNIIEFLELDASGNDDMTVPVSWTYKGITLNTSFIITNKYGG